MANVGGSGVGDAQRNGGREVDQTKMDSFGVYTNAPRPGNAPSIAFLMNRKYDVDAQLGERMKLSEIAPSLMFPSAQFDDEPDEDGEGGGESIHGLKQGVLSEETKTIFILPIIGIIMMEISRGIFCRKFIVDDFPRADLGVLAVGAVVAILTDAIFTPLMAKFCDSFVSPFGRRRPFVFTSVFVAPVVYTLIYFVPWYYTKKTVTNEDGETEEKYVAYPIDPLGFGATVWTGIHYSVGNTFCQGFLNNWTMIPLFAMANELTPNYIQRQMLWFKFFQYIIAGMIGAIVIPMSFTYGPDCLKTPEDECYYLAGNNCGMCIIFYCIPALSWVKHIKERDYRLMQGAVDTDEEKERRRVRDISERKRLAFEESQKGMVFIGQLYNIEQGHGDRVYKTTEPVYFDSDGKHIPLKKKKDDMSAPERPKNAATERMELVVRWDDHIQAIEDGFNDGGIFETHLDDEGWPLWREKAMSEDVTDFATEEATLSEEQLKKKGNREMRTIMDQWNDELDYDPEDLEIKYMFGVYRGADQIQRTYMGTIQMDRKQFITFSRGDKPGIKKVLSSEEQYKLSKAEFQRNLVEFRAVRKAASVTEMQGVEFESNHMIPTSISVSLQEPMRIIFVGSCIARTLNGLPGCLAPFYIQWVIGENTYSWFQYIVASVVCNVAANISSFPFWKAFGAIVGKTRAVITAFFWTNVNHFLAWFIGYDCPMWIWCLASCITGFLGGSACLRAPIGSEIQDYDKFLIGKNREGQFWSGLDSVHKIIKLPSQCIPLIMLAYLGYDPNRSAKNCKDGLCQNFNVILLIKAGTTVIPATINTYYWTIILYFPLMEVRQHNKVLEGILNHNDYKRAMDPYYGHWVPTPPLVLDKPIDRKWLKGFVEENEEKFHQESITKLENDLKERLEEIEAERQYELWLEEQEELERLAAEEEEKRATEEALKMLEREGTDDEDEEKASNASGGKKNREGDHNAIPIYPETDSAREGVHMMPPRATNTGAQERGKVNPADLAKLQGGGGGPPGGARRATGERGGGPPGAAGGRKPTGQGMERKSTGAGGAPGGRKSSNMRGGDDDGAQRKQSVGAKPKGRRSSTGKKSIFGGIGGGASGMMMGGAPSKSGDADLADGAKSAAKEEVVKRTPKQLRKAIKALKQKDRSFDPAEPVAIPLYESRFFYFWPSEIRGSMGKNMRTGFIDHGIESELELEDVKGSNIKWKRLASSSQWMIYLGIVLSIVGIILFLTELQKLGKPPPDGPGWSALGLCFLGQGGWLLVLHTKRKAAYSALRREIDDTIEKYAKMEEKAERLKVDIEVIAEMENPANDDNIESGQVNFESSVNEDTGEMEEKVYFCPYEEMSEFRKQVYLFLRLNDAYFLGDRRIPTLFNKLWNYYEYVHAFEAEDEPDVPEGVMQYGKYHSIGDLRTQAMKKFSDEVPEEEEDDDDEDDEGADEIIQGPDGKPMRRASRKASVRRKSSSGTGRKSSAGAGGGMARRRSSNAKSKEDQRTKELKAARRTRNKTAQYD